MAQAEGEERQMGQAGQEHESRRRRTGRGLPDLGALFDEVDGQSPAPEIAAKGFADFALPVVSQVDEEKEKTEPVEAEEKAPPTRRRTANLGSLFDEVDQKSPTAGEVSKGFADFALPKVSKTEQQEQQADAVEAGAGTRPARRRGADLGALLSQMDGQLQGEPKKSSSKPAERRGSGSSGRGLDLSLPARSIEDEEPDEQVALEFPAELQRYLSPDLWRKLNSPSAGRGALFNALERVRSVSYLVATFVPANLVQEKMRRPVAGLVNGQMLNGSLLFADVSGFTPLSERLAALGPQGAEQVTAIMNQYFASMLEIISWSGGVLVKFAGDAMLVYFPEQEGGEHARWAVRAGQRMLRAMQAFERLETPKGPATLKMKVGLASGPFLAASVGSEQRMEYFVLGQAVTATMAAEGKTSGGGQLVVDAETARLLGAGYPGKPLGGGFQLLQLDQAQALDDFEIRPETRRGRGAIPWNASRRAVLAQIEVALRQVQALIPYLAPELTERVVAHARRRQVESEYRPTTVMFCNFTGPEELLARWGPAGAARVTSILNAYFSSMQAVIAHYGGIVSRVDPYSKGTKLLALFGAPKAHEDDPQRAVSAALAMNAELEALEHTWRRKFARFLTAAEDGAPDAKALVQQRIGISFGQTFAGQVGSSTRREYTVMGDEVNLAARLMGAAEMGQILVEEQVWRAAGEYFVFSALPPMRVKGKSKPILTAQAVGPRDDALAIRARSRQPLIGRQAELDQAGRLLQLAQGGAVLLLGPAGIGKSHLADEMVQRAEAQGVAPAFVQCRAYEQDTPYAAWRACLRSLAGVTAIDFNQRIQAVKLRALLARLEFSPAEIDALFPTLAALMGLSEASEARDEIDPGEADADERQQPETADAAAFDFVSSGRLKRRRSSLDLFQDLERQPASNNGAAWLQLSERLGEQERARVSQAVWQLFSRLANEKARLVFFEDAHWMDDLSLELLRSLTQRLAAEPQSAQPRLLFLLASRRDLSGFSEMGTTISLAALDQAGVTALAAHILVSDLAQVIYEQSDGNPLYVDEIARWFKRTRQISAADLRSVMQSSNILQKLVLSDLESLSEMQRQIVRLAAVVGEQFRTGEIAAMLGDQVDAVTLSRHLRAMADGAWFELVEPGADALYGFKRSLGREVLYNSLPLEQRSELHARLAQYLLAPSGRRQTQARLAAALGGAARQPAQEALTIAYHLEQAGQQLPAAEQYLKGAQQARQSGVFEKASQAYARALDCLEELRSERETAQDFPAAAQRAWFEAALGKGDMALAGGEYLAALSAFELCRTGGLAGQEANLAWRMGLVLPTQGKVKEALAGLQQVTRNGLPGETPKQDLALASVLAWLLWREQQPGAVGWARQAQRLAETGRAAQNQGSEWLAAWQACLAEFQGHWRVAVRGFEQVGCHAAAALALLNVGAGCERKGQFSKALEYYCQAGEFSRRRAARLMGCAVIDFAKDGPNSLAYYLQAGVYWRNQDQETAQRSLEQALTALPESAPALHAHGQTAIQQAMKMIARQSAGRKRSKQTERRLPAWNWQAYDDQLRIGISFACIEQLR